MKAKVTRTNGRVRILSREQARRIFDRQARREFHMSGEEFIQRWEAGEFGDPDDPYRPELWELVWQVPYVKK
jgi:hypothetical protein